MIRRSLSLADFSLRVATLAVPLFAFAVAALIRFSSGLIALVTTDIDPEIYFGLLLFTTIVWAIAIEHFGLTRVDVIFDRRRSAKVGLYACLLTFTVVMAGTFFYRASSFSRAFILLSVPTLYVLLLLVHQGFRIMTTRARERGRDRIRLLIVGSDEFAETTARSLVEESALPCWIVGYIRLPDQTIAVSGAPVIELSDFCNWYKEGQEGAIEDVIIAIPATRFAEIPQITAVLDRYSVPIRVAVDLGEKVFVQEVFDLAHLCLLDLRTSPSESVMYVVLKRAFDVVFSSLVIIAGCPLALMIALAVRLTSPGPVFFTQERVGLNGKKFQMYKFRTMRLSPLSESDTQWTTSADPRRTRLGALLRRTNLDELPQFVNVLKGEMSIVGPRPERPYFVQKFLQDIEKYHARHFLKVGITGWAQVNGLRGDTSIEERLKYDVYYIQNWSLGFDLWIILLTCFRGFFNKNAY